MNYVPFGEKAMSITVSVYLKTAHETPVIEGNVLLRILEVSLTHLKIMLTHSL